MSTSDLDDFEKRLAAIERALSTQKHTPEVRQSGKTTVVLPCPHCTKSLFVAAERDQQWTRLSVIKAAVY